MKYFSMFSGIGGFERAIQNVHPEAECVGYSEINKYASSIYERHFKHKNYGNASNIIVSELPDFDLLVGGFPCQAFSIAGKRQGFEDLRGTLIFEIVRVLQGKKPRNFLLENVEGLISHNDYETILTIHSVLTELGYDCQWVVLNSKNFGVPQNRARTFFIGNIAGQSKPKILSIPQGGGKCDRSEKINEENDLTFPLTTQSNWYGSHIVEGEQIILGNINSSQDGKVFHPSGISQCLSAGHGNMPKIMESEKTNIRRLTPIECERLQGFPDDWTKFGNDGEEISDTQRYKCCGNAVTVNVIEELVKIFNF